MAGNAASERALKALHAFGLKYPGAHTKSPWPGHEDLAVKDKTFVYLSLDSGWLKISCKLPASHQSALMLEHTSPTGYGLGKAGWVTAQIPSSVKPPLAMLEAWIDESYRAVAPKKLIASLDAALRPPPSAVAAKKKKKATKKVAPRSKR